MKKYKYYIGIDTGVITGLSIWDGKKLIEVSSVKIHQAMDIVFGYCHGETPVKVFVEDARQRNWFGRSGVEKLQGAGSIKRDAVIWEDFLSDIKIDFEMVAPKNNTTKLTASVFNRITGWTGKSSYHGRDAAMLVYGK